MNVLDLSLFHSMQRLSDQIRGADDNLFALLSSVEEMWEQFDWPTIERAYGMLHEVYRSILLDKGSNQYKLPHSGIRMRQAAGQCAIDLVVTDDQRLSGQAARNAIEQQDADSESEDSDEENA